MSPRLSDLLLRSQSDERLVSLARTGHDRAFASIVQRYRPELLALARRLTSDGRAEDLLQQAFLSAFTALRSGAEVQHLRGWLYQIVRNAATKAKPAVELPLDHVDVVGEPLEETVLRRARATAAMSALAGLPERQRSALVATALGGRGHADVARSMGISEQAVRQLVHRARATMRGAVTGITPWPLARWLATAPSGATPPELAITAGAVSSAGAAVKLGALFAATGALATGIVVGPLRHPGYPSANHSAAAHASHSRTGADSRTAPVGFAEAAPVLRVRRPASESRSRGRDARPGGSSARRAASHRTRLSAASTGAAGPARVDDQPAEHQDGGSATTRPQDVGASEDGRQSGLTSSEGSGSSHDGQIGGGTGSQDGSGSDGSTSSTSESASSVSAPLAGGTSGESDGGSSGSGGDGARHSGSESGVNLSDTSTDGE